MKEIIFAIMLIMPIIHQHLCVINDELIYDKACVYSLYQPTAALQLLTLFPWWEQQEIKVETKYSSWGP